MKKSMFTSLVGAALLVAVSGCGPLQENNATVGAAGQLFQGISQRATQGDSAPVAAAPALTREVIEAQGVDLLRVSIISREATGLVVFGGRNGSKVTWLNAEGLSLTFDNGLLIGTRGFGDDLMGSDVSGAIPSLNTGGNHIRTLDFLNGLSQIERRNYQCATVATKREELTIVERSYMTTVLEETCTGENDTFKNTYWRDDSGVIWQSRQWISAGVGYLGYQRL